MSGNVSAWLIWFLVLVYAAVVVASALEGRWYRALYFVGAILISIAVVRMR